MHRRWRGWFTLARYSPRPAGLSDVDTTLRHALAVPLTTTPLEVVRPRSPAARRCGCFSELARRARVTVRSMQTTRPSARCSSRPCSGCSSPGREG